MGNQTLDKVRVNFTPAIRVETVTVSMRIPKGLQETAYRTAEFYEVSFNDMVKQLLEAAIEQAKAQGMAQ